MRSRPDPGRRSFEGSMETVAFMWGWLRASDHPCQDNCGFDSLEETQVHVARGSGHRGRRASEEP